MPEFDANAAFPITDELLDKYLDSFEEPQGEGEELVQRGAGFCVRICHRW